MSIQNHGGNFEFKNDLGNAKMCFENVGSCVVSFVLFFGGRLYAPWLPMMPILSKPYMRV